MAIKDWPGGTITDIPVEPSGPYETSAASGIWTIDQVSNYVKQNNWPTAGVPNAPSLVSQQTAFNGSTTSITITAPTSIVSGNLLVAFICHKDTETSQKFTSIPSGWTAISTASPANTASIMAYYKTATGSEPASYTWSGATVSRDTTGIILNYSNASWDTAGSPYKYQSNPMTLTPNPTSLTVAADNSIVFFAAASEDQGKTISAPSGYDTIASQIGGSGQSGAIWLFNKSLVPAGSSGTPSTTLASTAQGYVLMAVINPGS